MCGIEFEEEPATCNEGRRDPLVQERSLRIELYSVQTALGNFVERSLAGGEAAHTNSFTDCPDPNLLLAHSNQQSGGTSSAYCWESISEPLQLVYCCLCFLPFIQQENPPLFCQN